MMRSFHDAVIVNVQVEGDLIRLRVEDVTTTNGTEAGSLEVLGVTMLEEDRQVVPAASLGAGFDDAEILRMEIGEGTLLGLLRWENYAEGRCRTVSFRILGRHVRWTPDPVA